MYEYMYVYIYLHLVRFVPYLHNNQPLSTSDGKSSFQHKQKRNTKRQQQQITAATATKTDKQ